MDSSLKLIKEECSSEYQNAIKLMHAYIKNIEQNVNVEKYRKIRIGNEKFQSNVWKYESCRTALLLTGFEQIGEFLILPAGVNVSQLYNHLQQEMKHLNLLTNTSQSPTLKVEATNTPGRLKLAGVQGASMFEDERKADMTLLSYLIEMGYEKGAAEKGLIATNNKGVQPAMDWIVSHLECQFEEKVPVNMQPCVLRNENEIMGIMNNSNMEETVSRMHKVSDEKYKYQETLRLQAIKKAKLEKAEDKRAKEYLMKNLRSERLQIKEKFEREKNVRHAEPSGKVNEQSKHTNLPHSNNQTMIRVKSMDGKMSVLQVEKTATVQNLYSGVSDLLDIPEHLFQIVITHPHESLDVNDTSTVNEKGLYPNGTIVVQQTLPLKRDEAKDETHETIGNETTVLNNDTVSSETMVRIGDTLDVYKASDEMDIDDTTVANNQPDKT